MECKIMIEYEELSDGNINLVLRQDSEMIASTSGQIIGDELHVYSLDVEEKHRRKGYGKTIFTELIRRSKLKGVTKATLEVRVGNEAAINLYRSFGFIDEGIRAKYYHDDGSDAIIMWLYDLGDIA